jgi:hypothetical protein
MEWLKKISFTDFCKIYDTISYAGFDYTPEEWDRQMTHFSFAIIGGLIFNPYRQKFTRITDKSVGWHKTNEFEFICEFVVTDEHGDLIYTF